MIKIYGATINTYFRSEDDSSIVFRVKVYRGITASDIESDKEDIYLTIKGKFPRDFKPGESVLAIGELEKSDKYGWELNASALYPSALVKRRSVLDILSSGVIYDITPESAKRLFNHYGESVFIAAEKDFDDFVQVGNLRVKNKFNFLQQVKWAKEVRASHDFLRHLGLNQRQAQTAIAAMGAKGAREDVTAKPYTLLTVSGIGLKTADSAALRLGIDMFAPERIRVIINETVALEKSHGSLVFASEKFLERLAKNIGCSMSEAAGFIKKPVNAGFLKYHLDGSSSLLSLSKDYAMEFASAQNIGRLNVEKYAAVEANEYLGPSWLNEQQQEAIKSAFEEKISIITGGPGVGKTTVLTAVLKGIERREPGKKIMLVAPTAKAARRMKEATGQEAQTVHALLGYNGTTFKYNKANKLALSTLVMDELSMLDAALFDALLDSLPEGCRLIFVGDVDQLPSVDAGNVLADLIDSGCLRVTRLTKVQRQAADSQIICAAHKVIAGEMPRIGGEEKDMHWCSEESDDGIVRAVKALLSSDNLQKKNLGLDDVQILTPSRRGAAGTVNLNKKLARIFNPKGSDDEKVIFDGQDFYIGDRVMQTRNVYKEGLCNGDVGHIRSINHKARMIGVEFDGELKHLSFNALNNLKLSYAITIHKSQGSEYKAVVIPISNEGAHQYMLSRNLVYTAITRGKEHVFMVGSQDVLKKALKKTPPERKTMLSRWIKQLINNPSLAVVPTRASSHCEPA